MACDCIGLIDKKLSERNTKLELTLFWNGKPPVIKIATEKINRKKRDSVSVVPTFCPFCGKRYQDTGDSLDPADTQKPLSEKQDQEKNQNHQYDGVPGCW